MLNNLQSKPPSPSLSEILHCVNINPKERSPFQKKQITSYLTSNISYFSSISPEEDKIEKICEVLHCDIFGKGNKITNCGDESDKFYILLQGTISIYEPYPKIKEMKLKDYIQYLSIIKESEKNLPKLKRVISYNKTTDHTDIKLCEYDYTKYAHQDKLNCINIYLIEEEKFISKQTNGFEFNLNSLYNKETCKYNIYAVSEIHILTLSKKDYDVAMMELEIKRKQNDIKIFKEKFPLFQEWPNYNMVILFKNLSQQTLYNEEYLYKQNEKSDYIYFINEGVFEMTSQINVSEYDKYIQYVYDSSNTNEMKLQYNKDAYNPLLVIDNESNRIFKAKIKTIMAPECLGYEEGIENKVRFCSVKCVSTQSNINVIHICEFLKLLPTDNHNKFILQKNIFEKKMYLISQIKSNVVKRFVDFDHEIQYEYDMMFNKSNNKEKKLKNTKKLLKSCSTENINISGVADTNKQKQTSDNATQTKNTTTKFVYECSEVEEVKIPRFHNQLLLRNQTLNLKKTQSVSNKNDIVSNNINNLYSSNNYNYSSNLMSLNTTNENHHIHKQFCLNNYSNYKSILDELVKLDKAYRRNNSKPFEALTSVHYTSFVNNNFNQSNNNSFKLNVSQSTSMSTAKDVKDKIKLGTVKRGESCKRGEIPTTVKLKYFTHDFKTKIMKRMRNIHKIK